LFRKILDYSLSILILVPALVVVAICAILVKLTSRGPAFYTQERVGRFGRVFTIYKLRTMHHRCELISGPQWSKPGDPRVTSFGKFLRASHLDELPQLINVLRGEMSLLGPRPERPEIASRLVDAITHYNDRLILRPGVSGHAQVHLPPDVELADVAAKVQLDRDYIHRLSFWFDLLTLVRTAQKVLGLNNPNKKRGTLNPQSITMTTQKRS
jgi:lipopolysaccharide/colanic/teichoic acid biosynthesis glycosyltransferase